VVLLAFAVDIFAAAFVHGFQTLVIFKVLEILGAVHRLLNVKLVHSGIT
jgi:hypothetical protein